MRLLTYYHTIKYLKFKQIYYRFLKKIQHSKPRFVKSSCAIREGSWVTQELYEQKIFDDETVKFLNHKGKIHFAADWNSSNQDKLWLYNLHYFEDLNSIGSSNRRSLQLEWIYKWITQNPANKGGNGWEAYTLSLRIVNWIKAFLSGLELDQALIDSLAQQADFLSRNLEKHLLGNHYFVNLKALIYAGCFMEGKDSDRWLAIGLEDLEKELKEQVLSDGGNFELTPMYHAIMLTDLLDLYNLFIAFPNRIPKSTTILIKQTVTKMFSWLDIMSHVDDKISFFNDAAFNIAPSNEILRTYARKLGLNILNIKYTDRNLAIYNMVSSGYLSIKSKDISLIADLSSIGPNYIPGHAHADSLSFELSLGKSRVFVNSGTSEYGISDERLRQRSTAAHNTVMVNNTNSTEVWSAFRVARRADIINRVVDTISHNQTVKFSAMHNGYKKQGINCLHKRTWKVSTNTCEIIDFLKGNVDSVIGFLHLHPDVTVISSVENYCILHTEKYKIEVTVFGANLTIDSSTWHPEFGAVLSSKKIILKYFEPQVNYQIIWTKL